MSFRPCTGLNQNARFGNGSFLIERSADSKETIDQTQMLTNQVFTATKNPTDLGKRTANSDSIGTKRAPFLFKKNDWVYCLRKFAEDQGKLVLGQIIQINRTDSGYQYEVDFEDGKNEEFSERELTDSTQKAPLITQNPTTQESLQPKTKLPQNSKIHSISLTGNDLESNSDDSDCSLSPSTTTSRQDSPKALEKDEEREDRIEPISPTRSPRGEASSSNISIAIKTSGSLIKISKKVFWSKDQTHTIQIKESNRYHPYLIVNYNQSTQEITIQNQTTKEKSTLKNFNYTPATTKAFFLLRASDNPDVFTVVRPARVVNPNNKTNSFYFIPKKNKKKDDGSVVSLRASRKSEFSTEDFLPLPKDISDAIAKCNRILSRSKKRTQILENLITKINKISKLKFAFIKTNLSRKDEKKHLVLATKFSLVE